VFAVRSVCPRESVICSKVQSFCERPLCFFCFSLSQLSHLGVPPSPRRGGESESCLPATRRPPAASSASSPSAGTAAGTFFPRFVDEGPVRPLQTRNRSNRPKMGIPGKPCCFLVSPRRPSFIFFLSFQLW